MTAAAMTPSSRELALELHRLLRELDPARFRDGLQSAAAARLERIHQMMEQLRAMSPQEKVFAALRDRMAELALYLEEHAPASMPSAEERKAAWMRFRAQMQPRYESLAKALRAYEVHVPSLRPTNYKRNVFHLANAAVAMGVILFVSPMGLLWSIGIIAASAWLMEGARRIWPKVNDVAMAAFKPFAHPHEAWRINSATWYATALFGLGLTQDPTLQMTGVMVLGVADPMAAIVGRRFGRTKLINGRSLQGSLAFVISGALAAAVALVVFEQFSFGAAAVVASCAAVPAAVAELVSKRIDDNFTIPLSAALGGWLGLLLLG